MLDEGEMDTVIGVGLDTVATFTGAVGKMLLRHAAVTGNPWFYPLGFLFTGIIDPVFDAFAYSFAAASIVTACAGLVIVWTVILAPFYLGEPLTRSRACSALLICAGTIGTGVAAWSNSSPWQRQSVPPTARGACPLVHRGPLDSRAEEQTWTCKPP